MSAGRAASGGRIDRTRPLGFRFDGQAMTGFAGDTLASALLANGVDVVARSFKYHRPRGMMAAGVEEANGFVRAGRGGAVQPCVAATGIALVEGLEAWSLNAWPNVRHDAGGLIDSLSAFLPAGFYYKTFLWPNWHLFEGAIRRMAGLGIAPGTIDADRYAHRHAQCDVLVIGGGPAGIAAAESAAAEGRRVMLVEAGQEIGGRGLWAADVTLWEARAASLVADLRVEVLTCTTAIGGYDHGMVGAVERVSDGQCAERLWHIRAAEIVIATGAIERPLVFPGNDVPGVMLASAAQEYAARYGVRPGQRAVIYANNDGMDQVATALEHAGVTIAARLDTRDGDTIRAVRGRRRVRAVATNRGDIACDLVCMSGGWSPAVHLFSQAGGTLRFCEQRQMFVPDTAPVGLRCVGAADGDIGVQTGASAPVVHGKAFVDFASDVTADTVMLAARENYASVEHLKRYTTLGMGPDQGRTSNVNGLVLLGETTGRAPGAVGTTKFRPPFVPVRFGTMAGPRRGALARPYRHLPAHDWHAARGAVFEDYGWLRPEAYPRNGETVDQAAMREAHAVREGTGLFDASPLGKIEVRGADAARFLDFIYVGTMSTLAPGRVRYGLMLDERGIIIDDGVCIRTGGDRFLVHTTSGAAERIAGLFDEWLQCELIDFDVTVVNVTAQWATATLSGPSARAALAALEPGVDLTVAAFPHMAFREATIGGVPARIARVSFTGEVSYEVSVPARFGTSLLDAASALPGVTLYGIAALELLRIEKGYIHVGTDTDGTTVPADIGFDRMYAKKQGDFIGRRSLSLPALAAAGRPQLVGLLSDAPIAAGAHVRASDGTSEGHVTSGCVSPTLGHPIALAMVRNGRARTGETVTIYDLGRRQTAKIVPPTFFDQDGVRLHG